MKTQIIAAVAHAINQAYCESLGDTSQPDWDHAPDWQKQSAMYGVEMHINNPDATPEQSHESWLAQKTADGWTYGEVKDAEKKQHPCCVPYDELPQEQKSKDYLFRAVVHALKGIPDPDELKAQWQQEAVAQYQQQMASVTSVKGASASNDPHVAAPVAVKYVGRRDEWRDSVYGTGLYFAQEQTRVLPADVARKLLNHSDLFAPGELEPSADEKQVSLTDDTQSLLDAAGKQQDESDHKLTEMQNVIDQISRMDKDALADYAWNNYQQKVPKNMSVENMRGKVAQMVNQFGVL